VPGRVVELLVKENQPVKAGQILFRLDARDFDVAIANARAQLAQARLQVRSTQSSYAPRAAELKAAQNDLAFRIKELARQRELTATEVGSQRELDERTNDVNVARQRVVTAQANVEEALATIGGSPTGPTDSHPSVQAAQAALDRAMLNRSYTVVVAPQDGLVTKVEQLQVGSYVNAAQPLFTLVSPRMWIDANFKEGQLTYMQVGQKGEAEIDAYPGQKFAVHLESLSPGTGSAFSILPAENATGNWVKVTQRLPVRVAFDDPAAVRARLHAGLSAKVVIDTQHRRTLGKAPPPAPPAGK
jgi:membrane fusion protein (multidrug efflux system)